MWAELGLAGLQAFNAYSASKSAEKGQSDANQAQMSFNAQEAEKQRAWEERMFSTRYQTTRKDLETAGYNPIMALGVNPGVPSGASASSTPQSTTRESSQIRAEAASRISQSALNAAQILKTRSEVKLTDAMTQTQATQQALNLANAAQVNRNAMGHVPFFNTPISSIIAAAQNAGGVSSGILGATAKSASAAGGYFNKVRRTFTEGKAFRDLK